MIFVLNQLSCIPFGELQSCFNESIRALDNAGIDCAVVIDEADYSDSVKLFYDFFEALIEKYFDSIKALLVRINSSNITISVNVDCNDIELTDYPDSVILKDDDGLFYCTLSAGGDSYV